MLKWTVIYAYIYKRTIYLSWILSAIIGVFSIFVSGEDIQNHLRFLLHVRIWYFCWCQNLRRF